MITFYVLLAILFCILAVLFAEKKAEKAEKRIENRLIAKRFLENYTPAVIKAYNMENSRFYNSSFSRVRGKTTLPIISVMRRKNFAKSNIFSRCGFCKGLKIRGVCQSCGSVNPCSWCGGVIQPDGNSRKMGYEKTRDMSHGMCHSCFSDAKKEVDIYIHTQTFPRMCLREDGEVC